ncbi:hypothetical protein BZG36_00863 [Bifiguratus adelaidae]|uniref:Monopolin complex subunit Csm1/Pcs1 C-terminal domain-containing protein n=1 Tax=Bifiguratus adelaidae TaxID=1938954 RepID=A0A261Y5H4_9FUNG|nr:hypothetical protein BZG36_00863 [Bifiguratus adelaidae]
MAVKPAAKRRAKPLAYRPPALDDSEGSDEFEVSSQRRPKAFSDHSKHLSHQLSDEDLRPSDSSRFLKRSRYESDIDNRRMRYGTYTSKHDYAQLEYSYKELEAKYNNLRSLRITEAEENLMEFKKALDDRIQATEKVVEQLKAENRMLEKEADTLRARANSSGHGHTDELSSRERALELEINKLRENERLAEENTAVLHKEIQSLKRKALKLERENDNHHNARSLEMSTGDVDGAICKDFYNDLSGVFIRDVKKTDKGLLFDCLQTGPNGTLHYYLIQLDDGETFEYRPRFEDAKDEALIESLPDYMAEEISFHKSQAPVFLMRITKSLLGDH